MHSLEDKENREEGSSSKESDQAHKLEVEDTWNLSKSLGICLSKDNEVIQALLEDIVDRKRSKRKKAKGEKEESKGFCEVIK